MVRCLRRGRALDLASAYQHYPTIADIKEGLADEALKQSIDLGPFMSPSHDPSTGAAFARDRAVPADGSTSLACGGQGEQHRGDDCTPDLVEPALHESLLAGMNKVATHA